MIAKRGGNKPNKVISALICDQEGRKPYAPIMGTGTSWNQTKKCNYDNSNMCDYHAESIIYQAAPKYFMDKMVHLFEEKDLEGEKSDSIFEIVSEDPKMFKLKSNVKFYLMITEPPCGFIQDKGEPCMEWKWPFVEFPHIPTCSSRILIGAKMGIQGYVSHLLKEPIMIDSVIVLCPRAADAKNVKTEFNDTFPLPIIKAMKYNPEDFHFLEPQNLAQPKDSKTSESNSSLKSKSTVKSSNKGTESSVYIQGAHRDALPYFTPIVQPTEEASEKNKSHVSKINYNIDKSLCIDKELEKERKVKWENLYYDLYKNLNLRECLFKLQTKIETEKNELLKKLEVRRNDISAKLQEDMDFLEKQSPAAAGYDKKLAIKKLNEGCEFVQVKCKNINEMMKNVITKNEMLHWINEIEGKELIMDCSWHHYLKNHQVINIQPTIDSAD